MLRNYAGPAEGNPDSNMPAIYDRTLFKSATPKSDFKRFTPDVVCVNLCTNDFSGKGPDRVLFEGGACQIVADGLGERGATVRWCHDGDVGLQFKQPLQFREFAAWRTRSKTAGRIQ